MWRRYIRTLATKIWLSYVFDVYTAWPYGQQPFITCQLPPPGELQDVLLWWLPHHQEEIFQWDNLPCSSQTDCFSCPIFSANSIAHALLPTSFPLIPKNGSITACIDMLLRIAGFWK